MPAWLAELRGVTTATRRGLKLLARFGPRTVDALETAVAVLLAVGCAHALGEKHVDWTAYSACAGQTPKPPVGWLFRRQARTGRESAVRTVGAGPFRRPAHEF